MIKSLKLKNVGPLPDATINFGKRLNIITGDNGLGKSFLLDIIWFGLTNRWPIEVNGRMTSGNMARPMDRTKEASIKFIAGKGRPSETVQYNYERQQERWTTSNNQGKSEIHKNLVLYAHYDGSFSVWDPYRNYWIRNPREDMLERPPAFVFTPSEVWDGATIFNNNTGKEVPICNGLIRDWVSWQDRVREGNKNDEFLILQCCLEELTPPDFPEKLSPAEHGRISTGDSREHPFIKMPYGKIPAILASAGIRRMLALAYMLTWTITEHVKSCEVLGLEPVTQLTFLFDEVDAHLHPKWQRQIMGGILKVLKLVPDMILDHFIAQISLQPENINTQIISVTHSPLVMASLESLFEKENDKWLDLDLNMANGNVQIEERDFSKKGDAEAWLTSEAFDLKSTYSVEAEAAMARASELLKEGGDLDHEAINLAYQDLLKVLDFKDPFLLRFRYLCQKKGVSLK